MGRKNGPEWFGLHCMSLDSTKSLCIYSDEDQSFFHGVPHPMQYLTGGSIHSPPTVDHHWMTEDELARRGEDWEAG